jgi:aldose sugar dehydrogenase
MTLISGKCSNLEFVWAQFVGSTAIKFQSSSASGELYLNDMFVADCTVSEMTWLSGNLADKVTNTDTETRQVIFGEGFHGVKDLKVGPSDGYLYVLSYGSGAVYKFHPKTASGASRD